MKDNTTKEKTFIQPEGVDCTGFIIHQPGDHSVGIWDASWELKGDFFFQDNDDFNLFTEAIATAFEYVCGDRPGVYSFEDLKEKARIEAELLKAENETAQFDDCTSPPKQTTLPNSGVVIAGHVHESWDREYSPALDELERKINDIGDSPDQFCAAFKHANTEKCKYKCWYCRGRKIL